MRTTWPHLLLFALAILIGSTCSYGQIRVSIGFGPPALPVYEQPICPGDGYIWAPGYWAWAGDDYYWVPGTWVEAPEPGLLWTPGYWGWDNGDYVFYNGYWGPTVGFYGGIDYGWGYTGRGYEGGRWQGDHFYYNRSVNNVNVTEVHNVYNQTVVNNYTTVNRVSYNGGNGGVEARPTPQEEAAAHQRHVPPVAAQVQHVQEARSNPELRASANHGKPPIAATPKPAAFKGQGVVAAKEAAPYHPAPAKRGSQPAKNAEQPAANNGRTAVHPTELPPVERGAAPNTGNAKKDQQYQQQQEKLAAKQQQDRQKLQAKQDQEHQRLSQQKANDAQQQQVEQRHQQQTQNLAQRQSQQQQNMQRKEQPARPPAHPPQQQEKPRPPQ